MRSWKPEFKVQGGWYGNELRFATFAEAMANAKHKFDRWTQPEDYRATESDDPVNYRWTEDQELIAVPPDMSPDQRIESQNERDRNEDDAERAAWEAEMAERQDRE